MKRFRLLLALAAAFFVAGCDASGKGMLDIHRPGYFYVGDGNPYGDGTHVTASPSATSYSSEITMHSDEDSHSAEVSIRIPAFTISYIQSISHFSCTKLNSDWTRCTGEEEGSDKHGPVHWVVDLNGKTVARAWLWEMKPSDFQVYLGNEQANRGPKLLAFFGNTDYRQQWPRREVASNALRREDSDHLANAMADLRGAPHSLPAESTYSGIQKPGDTGVTAGDSQTVSAGQASI